MMTVDSSKYSSLMRWSTAFLVLHSAAEGSLIPFLTIYFRQLGLSAWKIGILLSIKVLVGAFFGPLWRYFSRKYSKQKVLVILSVLACIVFRIGLSFLPPISSHRLLEYCVNGNQSTPEPGVNILTTVFQYIATTPQSVMISPSESVVVTGNPGKRDVSRLKKNLEMEKFGNNLQVLTRNFEFSKVSSGLHDPVVKSYAQNVAHENEILKSNISLGGNATNEILKRGVAKKWASMTKWRDKVKTIQDNVLRTKRNPLETDEHPSKGQSLSPALPSTLPLFLAALTVIMLGEMFASSSSVIVRDSLYHHLDDSDNLNQFPQTMTLCSISYGISAAVVTAIVDQIPCIIFEDKSSVVIQIICSGVFAFAALVVAFFLPVFQPHSLLHTSSRAVKALRYLYSDIHHIFLVLSCIFLGFLSSAARGFLFWHMQDQGSREFTMGFYLTFESFSQAVVHLKYMWLLRKLNHFGSFSLSFACLSLMYFYFGIMWNPWMALLIAPLGAFSHTLLWKAVSDFLEKSAPPGLYLAMFKQSQIFYAALGLVLGYTCVGFLSNAITFKLVFVFWGILALAWAVAMLLVVRYLPREETFHYAQLFHSKGGAGGDSEDEVQAEDWLEKALDEEEL
ncbi:Major facilitator superfamily domain-containing protein 6-like [Holothuria leucospilota]|uniref:Major facilitator superfamily domain-containing protein 6-like n=1 Tax=Holothuria leucospilota TaxID=206669 RepID=A0A9Q1C3I8_HOLLE|nr:Major facilitator superfamily domain-containing protein 6-like [Holothuria leucospilota]